MSSLVQFEISQKQIDDWKPINGGHPLPVDCVINVLKFVKVIDNDVAFHLSKLKNDFNNGTNISEILYFISQKYPETYFNLMVTEKMEELIKILNSLSPSCAIIGLLGRQASIGHAVIFAKNFYNHIYLLDPQESSSILLTEKSLINYIHENKHLYFQTLTYRSKTKIHKNNNTNTKRKRNEFKVKIRKSSKTVKNKRVKKSKSKSKSSSKSKSKST